MKQLSCVVGFASLIILPGIVLANNFILELDMNTGYNNNVFLESDDLIINQENDDSSTQDVQTQIAITANVEFLDESNSDASLIVDYFKERLLDNELDTTVTTLSLPMHYYRDDYRYGMTVTRQAYNLSDVDVLNYLIAKVDVAKKKGNSTLLFSYALTDKEPQNDTYSDYQGTSHSTIVQYKRNEGAGKWTLQGSAFRNEYLGDGLSNAGGYIKIQYQLNQGRQRMFVGVKGKQTRYDINTFTNDERLDRYFNIYYSHEYLMSSMIQLYLDTSYIRNHSNIAYVDENYNYNQWVNTLGVRFSF